jgi:hypothetical protein
VPSRANWRRSDGGGATPGSTLVTDDYLTVADVAARLKLTPKTVRNRMYDGTWRRGEHWFKKRGIGPRFRWLASSAGLKPPTCRRPLTSPVWRTAPTSLFPAGGQEAARGLELVAEQMYIPAVATQQQAARTTSRVPESRALHGAA